MGVLGGEAALAGEATGTKKQRDQLRATLRDQGCTLGQTAAEMSRQFGFRARQAWRHTHGWTQSEAAATYNRLLNNDHAPMTAKRISDYEAWPHGGKKPTINALATLARAYSTEVLKLVDLDDRRAFNTQELLTLDTYKTSPPPITASPSPDTTPDNNVQNLAATDEGTVRPEPNISITINQANRTPETATPSQRRWRWHLAIACLLAILATIGSAMTTQEIAREPHTIMPVPTSTPSPSGAPIPSSASALPPPPPSQTAPPQQPLISATPAPHQPPIRTPPSPSAQPDPQPPPPESPTTKTASTSTIATTMWKNIQTGWCLEQEENDALTVWPCDGRADQMWTEQIIPAHPEYFTRSLVNPKSGKCVTYQPESGGHISVSLAPCGKDGQGWIRGRNGEAYEAYIFQPAGIPDHMCMSAPMDIAAEGTRVQLRKCDPPSPLTEWQPSPNN